MSTHHPFSISVHELERRPGAVREISRTFVGTGVMGTPMISVDSGNIDLSGRLESVHDGVLITGIATAEASGQCSRCLKDITRQVRADIQELYFYPERVPRVFSVDGFDEAQANTIVDEHIDVESLIRSELVLQLPFMPVCDDACSGICAQCGQGLDDGHAHDLNDTDSRWEMLRKFKF